MLRAHTSAQRACQEKRPLSFVDSNQPLHRLKFSGWLASDSLPTLRPSEQKNIRCISNLLPLSINTLVLSLIHGGRLGFQIVFIGAIIAIYSRFSSPPVKGGGRIFLDNIWGSGYHLPLDKKSLKAHKFSGKRKLVTFRGRKRRNPGRPGEAEFSSSRRETFLAFVNPSSILRSINYTLFFFYKKSKLIELKFVLG